MKKRILPAAAMALAIGATGCKQAEESSLLLIGKDRSTGHERKRLIPATALAIGMGRAIGGLHQSTLRTLGETSKDFELSRVTVGLALEAETEVAEIMELGGEAVVELRYERLPN